VTYCLLAAYTEAVTAAKECGNKCCRFEMAQSMSSSSDSMYSSYGVASVSRVDKIIGLFCRILSLL